MFIRLALLLALPLTALAAPPVCIVAGTSVSRTSAERCTPAPEAIQGPVGQTGATGPRGATGPAGADAVTLPHVVYVPATADPIANGNALLSALAAFGDGTATPASSAQPYTIQLDAGNYSLPGTAILLPYVSLSGAGVFSTTIKGLVAVQNSPAAGSPVSVDAKQTISNLTLVARGGTVAFTAQLATLLVLDHIQIANTTPSTPSTMLVSAVGARFIIQNSLIGNLAVQQSLPGNATQTAVVTSIMGSEVDLVQMNVPAPAILLCQSNYNAAGVALGANCLP